MSTEQERAELLPCPFCGAGTTEVRENGRPWLGTKGWGEPVSVSVRHWCDHVDGQPSRMIERVGRDRAAAIAAWNRRAAPQPAESCASPISDKPACGSENGDCDSQPAEPEHATLNLQPSSSLQPVATAFFTERGEVAYTGIYDRTLKALEAVKTTRMGISSGSIDLYAAPQAAEPVKHHLKVSYDDKYDVLYVDCNDSNEPEPFDAEEDDKGILYRRAISDGRLIGITVMNFMGPHAESRYGKGAP